MAFAMNALFTNPAIPKKLDGDAHQFMAAQMAKA